MSKEPPRRVFIIKYPSGNYYRNNSGSTLPTIFMSYAKAAARVKIAMNECSNIPTVHIWNIDEELLGPTVFE